MLTRRHSSSPAVLAGLTFAGVVATLIVATVLNSGSPSHGADIANIGNGWAPPSGVPATNLNAAGAAAPYALYRPQDALASDSSISRVYVTGGGASTNVRLGYTSGVIVVLTPWPAGKDAASSYQRQWTESGQLGTLETINGHPAWVVPGSAGATPIQVAGGGLSGVIDPSINTVEMTIANVDILIAGPQSVGDLLRVASLTS